MVDSKENDKFDLGVKENQNQNNLNGQSEKRQLNDCRIKKGTVPNSPTQNVRL